jgi:hypothetical protein
LLWPPLRWRTLPSLLATTALTAGAVVAVGQGIDRVAVGRQSYLTNGCYACHGLEAQPSQIFAHARLKAPLRHFTELQTEAVQA